MHSSFSFIQEAYKKGTIDHNASLLLKNLHSNFTIDAYGKLHIIAKWNLLGRLVKWIKDRKDGSVTQKIIIVVLFTLNTLKNESENENLIFIEHLETTYDDVKIQHWLRKWVASFVSTQKLAPAPAYELGKKFLSSDHSFKTNKRIMDAAKQLSELVDVL